MYIYIVYIHGTGPGEGRKKTASNAPLGPDSLVFFTEHWGIFSEMGGGEGGRGAGGNKNLLKNVKNNVHSLHHSPF